ncbi:MAG TPA: 16S rRNA (guanine(966)-N(2))-methyltransferase RsmD [Acidobacteriaceae bacterium]|nr:16S rRNA (guanine(966)-N(2))-methyltransferase RsmD [Acidobacteriaceae bacterium]
MALMRVIAGTYRSRPLTAPRGAGTRPTSDRLRETLFNILAPRIASARFADLYAGTGAVGIEALSRGASHVFFAENAAPALAVLRANLRSLGVDSAFDIEPRGAASLLDRLARSAGPLNPPLDLVFLDPPWDAARDYTSTLSLLGGPSAPALLAPAALVIAEHSSKLPLPSRFGTLTQTRTLRQGDAALTFYALEP